MKHIHTVLTELTETEGWPRPPRRQERRPRGDQTPPAAIARRPPAARPAKRPTAPPPNRNRPMLR